MGQKSILILLNYSWIVRFMSIFSVYIEDVFFVYFMMIYLTKCLSHQIRANLGYFGAINAVYVWFIKARTLNFPSSFHLQCVCQCVQSNRSVSMELTERDRSRCLYRTQCKLYLYIYILLLVQLSIIFENKTMTFSNLESVGNNNFRLAFLGLCLCQFY